MPAYAPLVSVAEIFTGTAPQQGGHGLQQAKFIQIKDLEPLKRDLVAGSVPDVKRASPVQPGDVLLAARGEQATAIVATPDLYGAFPTLDVYLIRPDSLQLLPEYLVAWLEQPHVRTSLRASTTGALIPRIPVGSLRDLPIPLPRLGVQQAVGEFAQAARREQALLSQLAELSQARAGQQLANAFASLERKS